MMNIITRTRKQNCNRVRSSYKTKTPTQICCYHEPEVTPARDEIDLERAITESIYELRASKSYQAFRKQLERHPFRSKIKNVLGEKKRFQMVIYGLGNINSDYNSRTQFALALLLQWGFDWIGEVQVYDPVLKDIEKQVIEKFGCKVLNVDEKAKRKANVPTLAFMPNCPYDLYNNIVEANWDPNLLNKLVILGHSFEIFKTTAKRYPKIFAGISEYVLQSQKMHLVEEVAFKSLEEEFDFPLFQTRWHFFHVYPWMQLKPP